MNDIRGGAKRGAKPGAINRRSLIVKEYLDEKHINLVEQILARVARMQTHTQRLEKLEIDLINDMASLTVPEGTHDKLLSVIRDKIRSEAEQASVLVRLLPYVHPKLQAIDINVVPPEEAALRGMSYAELIKRATGIIQGKAPEIDITPKEAK